MNLCTKKTWRRVANYELSRAESPIPTKVLITKSLWDLQHQQSKFIQPTYKTLELVSPLENLEPFLSVFFLIL